MLFQDWSIVDKIEFLQRKVILNCIAYYELNKSPLSDDYYLNMCEYLIELQDQYDLIDDILNTRYGYVTHDLDVSTGFDLYYRLTESDREYLMDICKDISKGKKMDDKEIKDVIETEEDKRKRNHIYDMVNDIIESERKDTENDG